MGFESSGRDVAMEAAKKHDIMRSVGRRFEWYAIVCGVEKYEYRRNERCLIFIDRDDDTTEWKWGKPRDSD